MASYVKDECPVCKRKEYKIIGKINDKEPPVFIPDDSAIVKCKSCGLIYVNPMPYWDKSDYEKLYNDTYFSHFEADKLKKWIEIRKNVIPRKRFDKIRMEITSSKRKMLEIGAGEHAFMSKYLIDKGWDITTQ